MANFLLRVSIILIFVDDYTKFLTILPPLVGGVRVFKSVVRGFSLVHDPLGSHYEDLGGERVLKLDEAKLNSLGVRRRGKVTLT